MNKPKRQHFNAEMLQSRFTDGEGRLYFYDRRIPKKGVQRSIPKNIFVKKHLHTQCLDNGAKDFSVEENLSRLEGEANEVIEKIVQKARSGRVPYLTSQEKETFDKFLYFQWKRVPELLNERLPDHEIDKVILDGIEHHKAEGEELSPELQDIENNPHTMDRIRHNLRAMVIGDSGEESLRYLAETGLRVVAIYDLNDGFIIGSRPTLEQRLPDESPDSESSFLLLPLAHDVAVQPYLSYLFKGHVELTIESSDFIWEVNKAIMAQSKVIAGRSRELIASLTDDTRSCNRKTSTQSNRIVGPGGRIYFR